MSTPWEVARYLVGERGPPLAFFILQPPRTTQVPPTWSRSSALREAAGLYDCSLARKLRSKGRSARGGEPTAESGQTLPMSVLAARAVAIHEE